MSNLNERDISEVSLFRNEAIFSDKKSYLGNIRDHSSRVAEKEMHLSPMMERLETKYDIKSNPKSPIEIKSPFTPVSLTISNYDRLNNHILSVRSKLVPESINVELHQRINNNQKLLDRARSVQRSLSPTSDEGSLKLDNRKFKCATEF